MLAFVAQLTTLGQPQVPGREGGVLESSPKRRQSFERAREVVADRLGLKIAVDPQDWLQALDRQRLANDFLKALDQLVEALGWQAEAGRRLVAAIANENVVARLQRAEQVVAGNAATRATDQPVAAPIHQRRSVVRLGKLAGDQADDAAGPIVAAAYQGVLTGCELRFD